MLLFECMTPSGDECHCSAIKAFSSFQRPAACSPGPHCPSPLPLQGRGELFVYVGKASEDTSGDRLLEDVETLESGPMTKMQTSRRGAEEPGEVRRWFCRILAREEGYSLGALDLELRAVLFKVFFFPFPGGSDLHPC